MDSEALAEARGGVSSFSGALCRTDGTERAAGVPAGVVFATKPQIALELICEALADGVPPAPVLRGMRPMATTDPFAMGFGGVDPGCS